MKGALLLIMGLAVSGCADVDDLFHPSGGAQSVVQGQTCRLRDTLPTDSSKICSYDCAGSQVATSVRASDQCPTTATYP